MAKPLSGSKAIEALAVRRAKIADADKVRYRVYRAPDDFVAVIAESALMAMKVSGISNPHRIVRDLPIEQAAIEAKRIAREEKDAPVMLPVQRPADLHENLRTEMADTTAKKPDFVAMQAKDFQKKGTLPWARVLTPEMVEQAQAKAAQKAAPPAPPKPAVPMPEPMHAPADMDAPPAPEPEALPEPTPPAPQPAAPAATGELTPEEVEQLLNG